MLRFVAFIAVLLMTTAAQAGEFAGYLREVTGTATIDRGAGAKPLHKGDDIAVGDRLATGKDGRIRIEFADGGELVLAQNGKLTVDEYVYDPKKPKEGKAEMTVLDTAFAFTGGWLDKGPAPDVKMNLNFGTIGVRGTKLLRAMNKGECWIYLQTGAIDVYNKGGKVSLKPGEGTIMTATTKSPAAPHIWPKREIDWIRGAVAGETTEWKP
ncbi:MAG TPA: hypothetical protein VEF76_08875 [Patescibacteria group bacterium]|nr:hypothetical protein [Patescibacteria group bacterium]